MLVKKTDDILSEAPKLDGLGKKMFNDVGKNIVMVFVIVLESERIKTAVQWNTAEGDEFEKGFRLIITHFKPIKQVLNL